MIPQPAPHYQELVTTASFDWLVAEAVRLYRALPEHSTNEIKLFFVEEHARTAYGKETFEQAIANY